MALLLAVMGVLGARAQGQVSATLTAEPAEATVGDPISLTLAVTHPAGYQVVPPQLSGDWGSYTIVGLSPAETSGNGDGTETTTIAIDARLFAPGAFATPPLDVTLTDGQGNLTTVTAAATSVTINSVLGEGDTELRDIKAQAEMPYTNWALIATGALLVAAVVGGVIIWRRRAPKAQPVVDLRSPSEVALDDLARVEALRLPEQGRFKEHYSLVSDTVRGYIGLRYGFPVLERTTAEIRASLREAGVPSEVQRPFVNLLQESDLVKFTTMTPTVPAAQAILEQGRAIIEAAAPKDGASDDPGNNDGSLALSSAAAPSPNGRVAAGEVKQL